jgi:hypothetical protein
MSLTEDRTSEPNLQDESTLTEKHEDAQVYSKEDTINPPPDGGFAAWLVVLGTWCTSFCSFGWLNSRLRWNSFIVHLLTIPHKVLEYFRNITKRIC